MTLRRRYITFLPALLLAGCGEDMPQSGVVEINNPNDGLWQDASEVPFKFVLEQTYGVEVQPDEAILSSLGPTTTDGDGNVYMVDVKAGHLVSFDQDGGFRWNTGRRGEGPGEIQFAYSMLWDGGDQILITNQSSTRIDAFNLDGEFLESHHIPGPALQYAGMVGFLDSRRLVFNGRVRGMLGAEIEVVLPDMAWAVESHFVIDQSESLDVPQGATSGAMVGVLDGLIVVCDLRKYRLEFLDATGRLKRVVTRDITTLVRPGTYEFRNLQTTIGMGGLSRPISIGNGFHLVSATWPRGVDDPDEAAAMRMRGELDLEYDRTVDLYDSDWRLLYAWEESRDDHRTPNFGHVDADGRIYGATDAEFPQLGRYRVEVMPPN